MATLLVIGAIILAVLCDFTKRPTLVLSVAVVLLGLAILVPTLSKLRLP